MKRILLLTVMTFAVVTAYSQINFGIKAGVSSATIKTDNIIIEDAYEIRSIKDSQMGFHGGAMLQVNFFSLFIQPELILATMSNELSINDLSEGGTDIVKQEFTKLDFPVILGRRFGPARIGLGPVGTIMLGKSSELEEKTGYRDRFNTATFGYQVGAGLDILQFIALDVRYEGNLSKLGSGIVIGGEERRFDSRGNQFIFSVGIYF